MVYRARMGAVNRRVTRKQSPSAWTAASLIREGARRFRAAGLAYGHGTTSARDEAAWLALHALKIATGTPAVLARPVRPRAARRVLALFDRRIRTRKPAAYLTRVAWLAGLPFHVDERVIVPRSHLAGMLQERLSPWAAPAKVQSVLDLCTGSGCLAILAARAFPGARVDATDVSAAALAVARINVRRHRMGGRIRLVRSDLFSALGKRRYDVIVCNPPYVTAASLRRLPREYRHEPRIALAAGTDGLDAVRVILEEAGAHLAPAGVLVMEVGSGRARVERAFPGGRLTWAETPGGGDVLVARRDELPPPAPAGRGSRTARGSRAATARRTRRA
jgi:ribosomal protein L3 glutamine methyltransferase